MVCPSARLHPQGRQRVIRALDKGKVLQASWSESEREY